jgi:threonine/homoserine/homoserine lactone efflux protein
LPDALVVELTPGPNMGYLAAVASRHGTRVGLAVVGGIALGLTLLVTATVTGLSRFVLADHMAFQLFRWAGVAYMFWLAIGALRQRPQLDGTSVV